MGLLIGATVGFMGAKGAKANAGKSGKVDQSGGVVTVAFDSAEFVRGGLVSWLD